MPPVGGWKTGVYVWRNLTTGKVYVGGGYTDVDKRILAHRKKLRARVHCNKFFQAAWIKYGESDFESFVMERCKPSLVQEREQYWIDLLKAMDRKHGYNLCPVAGTTAGLKMSDEVRKKMSESRKGRKGTPHSEEVKKRFSEQRKGRKLTPEWIRNMSLSRRGKSKSEEHKAKIGSKHWSKGPNAEAISKRISEANANRVWSEESKMKMSNSKRRQ